MVVDDWPDYEYVSTAQSAVGWCYEALRELGKIPKEQADALIEQAFTAVLAKYPDSRAVDYAAIRLAAISIERGDSTSAAAYYRMFLKSAQPDDPRIQAIKAELEKMEGGQQ